MGQVHRLVSQAAPIRILEEEVNKGEVEAVLQQCPLAQTSAIRKQNHPSIFFKSFLNNLIL
jgi:hypothetical protein